jgi:signal transduction histidine kinase/DNA-binding NarL/FixJ family response regulator/HPt (histidine-containing phosphotransfer) domain-containing protein
MAGYMIMRSFNQKTRKTLIRYLQVLFVALAFMLMVIASYRFMSDMERKHLHRDVKEAILYTEANIKADMLEPKTILASFAETIRGMILREYSDSTLHEYILYINNYMQSNEENRMLGITGFYVFFDAFEEKFFDADDNWVPPEEYVPQRRPWYLAAVEANGGIGVTQPYTNIVSGDVSITFSRRIFDEDGEALGVVCLDIKLDRIRQHTINTKFAENGYGFMLSENMEIIVHPEPSVLGMAFHDVKSRITSYEDELKRTGHITEAITTDYRGIESIVFIERLYNGWYMGIVTPRNLYFKSTRNMAMFLTALGAALAVILITILLALFSQMNKENEKSQAMAHWYNSILNAVPLPITVTDPDAKWTFINEAVEKLLGLTLKDVIGKPCSGWGASICNTPDCGIVCAKRGIKQTYFDEGDSSYQVDVAMLKDLYGKTMGYIEVVQDITNLKLMAKKQADAEAANSAKSAFLAKVSHEIRTPMNAILGITEIQLRNETLSEDTREGMDKIYNSGYLLLGIINDILDLSKIEAGKLELHPVEYDIPSLINDTVNLNVIRYENKPIKFTLHVDENIPLALFGDELRIKQILNNLLSNAFKYTASGKVSMSVTAESPQEESDGIILVFRVSDTGQGMTVEQLNRLYDEYTRFNIEANRSVEGTGLGMSITKHLVKMMNGEIHVESEREKGSVFTVRILQGIVAGSSILGRELAKRIGQLNFEKTVQMKKSPVIHEYMPYGRVLVVDDIETNLYVTRGLLTPYGLSVETAASGYEAVEKVKNGITWDIIFMDHFMPGMDGIEAAKIIRSLGYKNPIVALTANVLTGQAEMFFANGFDDFISKPIDVRQLNAVLNKLVRDKYPAETVEAARRLKSSMEKSPIPPPPANSELAKVFARDAEKAAAILEAIYEKRSNYTDEDIRSYIINVHSMKSALANIGEAKLSAVALKLEEAGRKQNISVISNETPAFLTALRTVIEKINPNKDSVDVEAVFDISDDDRAFLLEKLADIRKACAKYDKKTAKDALAQLRQKTWPNAVGKLLEKIAEHLLHSEFAEAANMAEDCKNV